MFQVRCIRVIYVQRIVDTAKREYYVKIFSFENNADKYPARKVEHVVVK